MKNFIIFGLNIFNLLLICFASPIGIFVKSDGSLTNFSYDPENPNAPEHWKEFAPICGGDAQSPINIQTTKVINNQKRPTITGTKWDEIAEMIKVENNGHTVKFEFEYEDGNSPVILVNDNEYEFVQLHFHFGDNSKSGSEHTINNVAYAMEGHAVFYNRKYESFSDAQNYPDGLTVIGRFFNENYYWSNININFDFLSFVRIPEQTHVISLKTNLFSLENIMGPLNWPYYTYDGSLTTPGCNEVVTWVVGAKPFEIWNKSLFEFRQITSHEGLMAKNFRPVQKVNGRPIYYLK